MESKKILIITTMMVVIMLSLSTIVEAVNIGEKLSIYGKLGDVNRDGRINQKDIDMIQEYNNGKRYLTILQRKRADTNQDGKINFDDAVAIVRYTANSGVRPNEVVNPTSVRISGSTEVEVGKTIQLTATVKPDNATNKNVTWTSSKESVATVDNSGKVKGISEGTVRITAKCADKSSYINIKVKPTPVINVSSVEIRGENRRELEVGKTLQLEATVRPDNATNKNITWSSSKESVATVDNTGKVTANSEGTAKIRATSGTKTDEVTITVKKPANKKLSDYPAVRVTKTSSKPNTLKLNNNNMWIIEPKASIDYNINMNKNSDYKCSGAVALYYANRFLGYNVSTSVITNDYVLDPEKTGTATDFPAGGYIYNGTCGSYNNQINTIYQELLKGYPVPIAVRNSDGKGIYVLAYGVRESSAQNGEITARDIGVVDTVTGARISLANYYQLKINDEEIFKLATLDPNYISYTYTFGGNTYKTAVPKAKLDATLKTIQDKKIYQHYGDALDRKCARVATYYIYMINGKISNPSRSGAANFEWPSVYATKTSASGVKSLVDSKILSRLHVKNSKYEHWSTVIGYKGNGTNLSDYLLLDPYDGVLLKGGTSTSAWLYGGTWKAIAYK